MNQSNNIAKASSNINDGVELKPFSGEPGPIISTVAAKPIRSRDDVILTIRRYRELAKIAKEYGIMLDVGDFYKNETGLFGQTECTVTGATKDATDPNSKCTEHRRIVLAERWKASIFSRVQRPEIDLTHLPSNLMMDFVFWHEIGLCIEAFSTVLLFFDPSETKMKKYFNKMLKCNTVLADRYAWNKIFPGEAQPVIKESHDRDIAELLKLFDLKKIKRKPLPTDQYKAVPLTMLTDDHRLKFIGPKAVYREYCMAGFHSGGGFGVWSGIKVNKSKSLAKGALEIK